MAAVQDLKNKLLSKIQNTRFLKELREFDSLIKAIGECKSKSEEDRIITGEIETLKQRFADPKIDRSRGREYMVRLIYCEMLGHDVSWAYVKALQFASEPNILTKKAAYLALTQFFDHNHELVLLLVNTLLSDLKSDNFINVSTALVVCTKLIGPDLISALYPLVVDRLKHPKEHVRKKAIMALHRFYQLDPRKEGPLSGVDLDKHFRTMLCDKDPGVMSAALCALHDIVRADPAPYKNLIPSFISILKQVAEHRLPKSYDYHRFPAPFIQIKLLKILALLGAGDRASSENMYAVVQQALRRAGSSHTIGNALLFECVTTITTIFPNPHLLASAAEAVAVFLKSPSHNLRYVGVDALAGIIKINPQAATEHQLAVVDCLEDPDDTLRLKTLELLYKMTKASNVEVIVERMVNYLRTVTDDHIKRDIVRKVSELAERYAPSPVWFIRVVSEVLELAGDHVEPGLAHALTRLIAEQDTQLHRSAVEQYSRLLDVPAGRNLPDVLLQVMVWVLGEYGSLLCSSSDGHHMTVSQLQSKLVSLVMRQKSSDTVRQLLPPALVKLSVQAGTGLSAEAEQWVHKATASQSTELQQRAYELQALLTAPQQVQRDVLPHDASCEDIDDAEVSDIKQLGFLNWYVEQALQAGAAPYQPPQTLQAPMAHERAGAGGALRFEAYEAAPAAPAASAGSAYHASHNGQAGGSYAVDEFLGGLEGGSSSAAAVHAPAAPQPAQPHGPQLLAALNKQGPNRWGPAQFEPSPSRSTAAAGPAVPAQQGSPAIGGADLLGDMGTHSKGASRSGKDAHVAPTPAPSERDRLAASLFAGLGGGGARGGAASVPKLNAPPAATTSSARPAPVVDLLSLDDPAPAPGSSGSATAPTTTQPAKQGLDFLMDFSSPRPAAGAMPAAAPSTPATASLLGQSTALAQKSPVVDFGLGLDNLLGPLPDVPAIPAMVPPHMGGSFSQGRGVPNLIGSPGVGGAVGGNMGQPGLGDGAGHGGLGGVGFSGLGLDLGFGQPFGGLGINSGQAATAGPLHGSTGLPQPVLGGSAMAMRGGPGAIGEAGTGLTQRGVTSAAAFSGLAQAQLTSMTKPVGGPMSGGMSLGAASGTPLTASPAAPAAQPKPTPASDPFGDLI